MRQLLLVFLLILGFSGCKKVPPDTPTEHDILPLLARGMVHENFVDVGDPAAKWRRLDGWRSPGSGESGTRQTWTGSDEARLSLPWTGEEGSAVQFLARVYCEVDPGPARQLRFELNGVEIHRGPTPERFTTLAVDIPEGIVRKGENELLLGVDRVIALPGKDHGMLVDFVGLRRPTDEPAPQQDPNETPGQRVLLADGRPIRFRIPELSETRMLLRCFSEFLPAEARIHVRLPETPDSWAGFDGAVIDRKAEFFVRFPPNLPKNCLVEFSLTGAADLELRIQHASFYGGFLPKNVVLIVIDTLRADYLGSYGHPTAQTPRIDQLAADGVLFEKAFAHIPLTGPSHAALLQSQTPSELGVLNNLQAALPAKIPTLAELLVDHEYQTAATVSIDALREQFGYDRGFEDYDARMGSNWIVSGDEIGRRARRQLASLEEPFFHWVHFSDPHEPYDAHGLSEKHARILLDGREIGSVETTRYLSKEIALELPAGESTLRIESENPFFVRRIGFLGPISRRPKLRPRIPYWEPALERETTVSATGDRSITLALGLHDELEEGTLLERYEREVEFIDGKVGELLDALQSAGLYEESWVVFTSDHGEGLGCHDQIGHVQNLYDCLVHVPLIIKPPASSLLAKGIRRQDVCSLMDLAPTLLEGLGAQRPSTMKGENLFARAARAREEAAVFLETHAPQATETKFAVRTNRWKLIWTPVAEVWELYDLDEDPGERNNLSEGATPTHTEVYSRLQEMLREIQNSATEQGIEIPMDEETTEILKSLGYVQ